MAILKLDYSCKEAFALLTVRDAREARQRLMEIFGCNTKQQFYQRRKRYTNIPAHIKEEVERMFQEYGLRKEQIWKITES